MKKMALALCASLCCVSASAFAQAAAQPASAIEQPVATTPAVAAAPTEVTIPAGLSVPLALTSTVSSSRVRVGETVGFTVPQDVVANGVTVIPRGTRGVGEITMRSGRGMFGKSGKLEIAFRYLDVDGIRVPLEGAHFQAGNGNTAGTVGAVLAAGVVGGMVVTGRSANITEGAEFTARTLDALPLLVETPANMFDRPRTRIASGYSPSAIQTGSPRAIEQARLDAEARAARSARRYRAR